jgi:hypothetical protein
MTGAPPERDAWSLTSSHLPPAPSISSSRACQECEPISKGISDHTVTMKKVRPPLLTGPPSRWVRQ